MPSNASTPQLRAGMVVGALGVVFGDIGTSPIYTVQTLFNPGNPHPVPMNQANIYGVVSLIFWSVMIIVTLTYVALVMRADNDGEGGVMALITLVGRLGGKSNARLVTALCTLGVLGSALFFGDSMITPAISVLSAVEGLKILDPGSASFVVPITAIIITGLFALQRRGTAAVGRFFGPVMIVWFVVIGLCGIRGIAVHPQILLALSPTYAWEFLTGHFHIAFFALAAVVLAVTGAAALYADLGHFGRRAITWAWLGLVLPAVVLSYFGQAALLLDNQSKVGAPFFLLAPAWAHVPLIVLTTTATVIASQAVISGTYSVANQAMQLGYLPRMRVAHTSETSAGQIYVPLINAMLMVAVLVLVFTFQSSAALGYAYGMAVTGTITITTLLFLYVARMRWHTPLWLLALGGGALLTVDLLFLAANLTKLRHGAWLPLLIGLLVFTVFTTWHRGHGVAVAAGDTMSGSLPEFVRGFTGSTPALTRPPGTAVFLDRGVAIAPLSMWANVDRIHALAQHAIVVSVNTASVPRVPDADRVTVNDLGGHADGIYVVATHFGFMEHPDLPTALRRVDPALTGGPIDVDHAAYFLSEIDVSAGPEPVMAPWRKRLFITISHIASEACHLGLPLNRTTIIGTRIEI
ncbi:MAG: KUP/HAK/KT family potassium transporter [Mycobacterium sp.]|nr:KUP/HAK/KT family potassium transporter [Mycobacterium sp.]